MLIALATPVVVLGGCRGFDVRTNNVVRLAEPLAIEPLNIEPLEVRLPPLTTPLDAVPVGGDPCAAGAIAIIDVDGPLLNRNDPDAVAGENPVSLFKEKLATAASRTDVMAVVLRINSSGGSVLATEVMHRELVDFKTRTGLPVVACIMDIGAGGGYYLATAADRIVTHRSSLVGGVGVIMNLYDVRELMATLNVFDQRIKSGKNIDMGTNADALPEEVESMLQTIADRHHEAFLSVVRSSRGSALVNDRVLDGRVVDGERAVEVGLVDEAGSLESAIALAGAMGGVTNQSTLAAPMQTSTRGSMLAGPSARWILFRRGNDHAGSPYAVSRQLRLNTGLMPITLPGVEKQTVPTFLYMWQPIPHTGVLSSAGDD